MALLPSHAANGATTPSTVEQAISALSMLAADAGSTAAPSDASANGAQPDASGAKKKAESIPSEVTVVAGYQNNDISGNWNKANQYVVKPNGAFIDLLGLSFDDDATYGYGKLLWAGFDEAHQKIGFDWESPITAKTRKFLKYQYDRADFFLEPSQDPVNPSDRRDQSLRYIIAPDDKRLPEITLNASQEKVYAPGIMRYAVGATPGTLSYYTQTVSPQVSMPFAGGDVTLTYSRNEFGDHTNAQPHAGTNLFQIGYDGEIGTKTQLFGSLSDVSISQSHLDGIARRRTARLGLVSQPLDNLTASLQLSAEGDDQPNTLNAYVRTNNTLIARLRYRPERMLVFEGAYERQNLRRLNNPQNYIDAPSWDGGWLSVRLNPGDRVSIFVRQRLRRLHDAPQAAIPNLENLDSLLYNKEDDTDAYLTVVLPANALFYANYNRNKRDNTARDVGSKFSQASAGVTVPLSSLLTLNADWTHQNWDGVGSVLTVDPLRLNYGLPFVSDGDYWNLGFSYLPGKDTLTGNVYRFTSSGGESVRGTGFTLNYERPMKAGVTSRLQIGKDKYNDHVLPGFNYSDSFIRIDLGRRF
jgi:hypothetical protein